MLLNSKAELNSIKVHIISTKLQVACLACISSSGEARNASNKRATEGKLEPHVAFDVEGPVLLCSFLQGVQYESEDHRDRTVRLQLK